MAEPGEFKIKGAAKRPNVFRAMNKRAVTDSDSIAESKLTHPHTVPESDEAEADIEDGQIEDQPQQQSKDDQLRRHRWYKCFCDPLHYGRDHYYLQTDTQESTWDQPNEPFWIWDADKQAVDERGLQFPASLSRPTSEGADPDYYGYNPKIHGNYDPNAPYAQYHNMKRAQEAGADQVTAGVLPMSDSTAYAAAGTFNRFTGDFQAADKSMEQHDDFHKSGRQMGAYFDVDAAANSHDGRSLKEERRNQKLTREQINELNEKRKARKEKKRLDFYRS